jgi:hypothetical protein
VHRADPAGVGEPAQVALGAVDEALADVEPHRLDGGVGEAALEEAAPQATVADEDLEEPTDAALHRVPRLAGRLRPRLVVELGGGGGHDAGEHVLLVAEVEVEGAVGRARRRGDGADRGAGVALHLEDVAGGGEQLLLGRGRLQLAAGRSSSGHALPSRRPLPPDWCGG